MRRKIALIYKTYVAATGLFLLVYYLLNPNIFSGYINTLLFFAFGSIIVLLPPDPDFRWLWASLPLSLIFVSIFFRTHVYPEILFLAFNRVFLRGFSLFKSGDRIFKSRVFTVYANIVIFLLLAEVSLNLVYLAKPLDILKRKNDIFRLQPNSEFNGETVNRSGYMGMDFIEKKRAKRLLFIGDSFGVGIVEYKNNFIRMVEDSLGFETVNLSQPGFSPVDYLSQLKIYSDSVNADAVFIVFFAGNDIYDIAMPENNWSIDNLKTVNLVRNICILTMTRAEGKNSPDIRMDDEKFISVERERASLLNEGKNDERWKLFEKCVKGIRDESERMDLPVEFIIIPDQFSIDTLLQKEIDPDSPPDRWKNTAIRMESIFKLYNIRYLDMTKPLEEAYMNGENPYKKNDTHINEYGNLAVYRELKKYLLSAFPN